MRARKDKRNNKKRNIILWSVAGVIILVAAAFFLPIGSAEYPRSDVSDVTNDMLKVTRYPLAVKIQTGIFYGACDKIHASSTMESSKQVITITTSSTSELCTMQAAHSDISFRLFSPFWQKDFVVKDGDEVIYEGQL